MEKFLNNICEKYGIKNDNILDESFLNIPIEYLPGPNAYIEWGCLLASYRKQVSLDTLKHISVQNAKVFQSLRNKGFIMAKTKHHYTICDGKFRRIDGWELPAVDLPNQYIKLSKSEKEAYISGKRDPYTMSRNNLQIDHRTPCSVSIKIFKEQPAVLTPELITSGEDKELFQVISIETNARKREICKKCLAGRTILLPSSVLNYKMYKRTFDNFCHLLRSCKGCYWYNSLITQEDVEKEYAMYLNRVPEEQLAMLANHYNCLRN